MPTVWDGRESILEMKDAGFKILEADGMDGLLLSSFCVKNISLV